MAASAELPHLVEQAARLPENERIDLIEQLSQTVSKSDQVREALARLRDALKAAGVSINRTPDVCGGRARVGNTRIPVWTLIQSERMGLSDEQLLYDYPSLTPAHLKAARDYYRDHRTEIERDIADQGEDQDDEDAA